MPFCSSCGTEVPAESRFCQACGHQLVPEQTPAPAISSATGSNFPRPMTLGDILGETFRIYKQYLLRLWAIVLVAEVLIAVVTLFFTRVVLSTPMAELQRIGDNLGFTEAALEQTTDDLIIFAEQYLMWFVVGFLVMLVITSFIGFARYGALVYAVSEQYVHQRMDVGRAYRFALRRLAVVLGVTAIAEGAILGIELVVISITIAVYFVFTPFVIVGIIAALVIPIYLLIRWSLIWPVVLLEGEGPINALSRSAELVKGNWWRVFGIMAAFIIMLILIGLILNISVGAIPIAGPFVVGILVAPILPVLHILLYYDLRTRNAPYSLDTMEGELNIINR